MNSLLLTLLLAEFLLSYPVFGVLSGLPSLLLFAFLVLCSFFPAPLSD